jgi:hypothetical protein
MVVFSEGSGGAAGCGLAQALSARRDVMIGSRACSLKRDVGDMIGGVSLKSLL